MASTDNQIAGDGNNFGIKIDINNNNEIEINEAILIKHLNVSNSNISDISSLSYFVNLTDLNFNNNTVNNFNINFFPRLSSVYGNDNIITSLEINNHNQIYNISFDGNINTSVSVNNCSSLTALNVNNSNLVNLTITNCPNLYNLGCYNNQLQSLDLSNMIKLKRLLCFENNLTSLNLTNCTALYGFYANNNSISSLDLSTCTSLFEFDVNFNQLVYLNVKNGVRENAYGICDNPNLINICADIDESEINLLRMQLEVCEYNNIELNTSCALNNTEIFDVFPNPTSEMININFYNKTVIQNIKIYNSIGQIVANIEKPKFSFKLPVDFSNFRSGNYFVSISTNYGIETKRFIKN